MKLALALAVLSSVSTRALADQCEAIPAAQALKAQDAFKAGDELLFHCEPCDGSMKSFTMKVADKAVVHAGIEDLKTVQVNGKAVDVAYLWVRRGTMWDNVAKLAGCPTTGVSAKLATLPKGVMEVAKADALRAFHGTFVRKGDAARWIELVPMDHDHPAEFRLEVVRTAAASGVTSESFGPYKAEAKGKTLLLKKGACELPLVEDAKGLLQVPSARTCSELPKDLAGEYQRQQDPDVD